MKKVIKERRVVYQDWYETEHSKTGWETNVGWYFKEGDFISPDWEIKEILESDKFGNPILAVAEKDTEIT